MPRSSADMGSTMQLDADAAAVLDLIRQSGRPPYETMSVAQAREAYDAGRAATQGPPQEVAAVETLQVPGSEGAPIALRLYRPLRPSASPTPVVVYLHGGGWVLGSLESHDGLCRRLANASGCAVASVDYRLAPEHPFPAAGEDALAATRWVAAEATGLGLDRGRIAIGGDSAGANLALITALAARDGDGPALGYQLLLYPVTDLAMDTPSHRLFAEGHLLTSGAMHWFADHYLAGRAKPDDWRVSPLKAPSLSGLPPTYLMSASHDPLRDEGEALALRLVEEGVETTLFRAPGQIHGFLPMDRLIAAATPCLETAARHLRCALAAAGS